MKKLNTSILFIMLLFTNLTFSQNTFSYKFGDFEIILLSESQSKGNTNILIGATPEMIEQYIPDGTFPNAVNAFLVKTPENNILIDAGFGNNLVGNLSLSGVQPEEIDILLLTHMHGDHIGGMIKDDNAVFKNAKVYLSQYEYNYWTNDQIMNNLPENRRLSFNGPRNVIKVYEKNLHIFQPNELNSGFREILPGVQGIAAYGHTPGHVMYLFESDNEKLLVWGDLTHANAIQMPYPHVAVTYDTDPQDAITSRNKVLDHVTKHKIPVAGMHIAFPGMGEVRTNDAGGYRFIPFK